MLKLKYQALLVLIFLFSSLVLAKPVPKANDIAPKDLSVINEERIIYWLIKRGELSATATETEKREAIEKYIGDRSNPPISIEEIEKEVLARNNSIKYTKQLRIQQSNLLQSKAAVDPITKRVKVLAIAIDFPDLPYDANRLTPGDTKMYYEDYDIEHYQQLMFADKSYSGPAGQALQSARNYYTEESGGSFSFEGKVYGWVTADNNAAYYGAKANGANDQNPRELIREALAKAVAQYNINLADYDLDDRWDLDGDGNINEPDGYIDHIMIFHSSMGEDAGGGVLGSDAIWSHKWVVSPYYDIPGTYFEEGDRAYRPWGYTIVPIDAAIGVVSHEFGHDLGLKDEYDTNKNIPGSPVGYWSIMASGSWTGAIPGSEPVTFGAMARSSLQNWYGGNWANEAFVTLQDLKEGKTYDLVEAVNHDSGINQIKVEVPKSILFRNAPFSGDYQYHSGAADSLNNSASFNLVIPEGHSHELLMKAFWEIEADWDYAQILVNGEAIAGNLTKDRNPLIDSYPELTEYDIQHYLTGESGRWLDLVFDLSTYAGQTVEIKITYYTDANTTHNGLFIDDIQLLSDGVSQYFDDAEVEGKITLNGYLRTEVIEQLGNQEYYYIQLRSHNGNDSALPLRSYDKGILMWFSDTGLNNNQSSVHPGRGFASVIDADQNLIENDVYGIWWTRNQIRDAAFSLYPQRPKAADNHLDPIPLFDDTRDYSTPEQPESGVSLPIHGLSMEILHQAGDSSTAQILLTHSELALTPRFNFSMAEWKVDFANTSYGGAGWLTYEWDFGDGTASNLKSPSHTFKIGGEHLVRLTVTDQNGDTATLESKLVLEGPSFTFEKNDLTVMFTNTSTAIVGEAYYHWDFGDGQGTSNEELPVYTYADEGSYIVKLTVTDDSGSKTAETVVTVTKPPLAAFTYVIKGLTVKFINQSKYGAGNLTYHWDFGERVKHKKKKGKKKRRKNATSNDISPTHTYRDDESYQVILTVKDQEGRTDKTYLWVNLDDDDDDENDD
ncbi:immune inhibitor A domain-containing protein [Aliikangiella sp. IMCC44359]|uniref:immune inhibitor A domain-containing protein n=1 Tax=Aliikangiella sp. IMCC44359 TaxID=3459125 RepID=UPI00403B0416